MRYYSYLESKLWRNIIIIGCLLYLLASLLELPFQNNTQEWEHDWYIIFVEVVSSLVFIMDMFLKVRSQGYRRVGSDPWTRALVIAVLFNFLGIIW